MSLDAAATGSLELCLARGRLLNALHASAGCMRNVCNSLLDVLCLQSSYDLSGGPELPKLISALGLEVVTVPTASKGILLLGPPYILRDNSSLRQFCATNVNAPSGLPGTFLLVLKSEASLDSLLTEGPLSDGSAELLQYLGDYPANSITVITKSAVELGAISRKLEQLGLCPEADFDGCSLPARIKCAELREQLYTSKAHSTLQLSQATVSVIFQGGDAVLAQEVQPRLGLSATGAVSHILDALMDSHGPSRVLLETLAYFGGEVLLWMESRLQACVKGMDKDCSHSLLVHCLERMNSLFATGEYPIPPAWARVIEKYAAALQAFSQVISREDIVHGHIHDQSWALLGKFGVSSCQSMPSRSGQQANYAQLARRGYRPPVARWSGDVAECADQVSCKLAIPRWPSPTESLAHPYFASINGWKE